MEMMYDVIDRKGFSKTIELLDICSDIDMVGSSQLLGKREARFLDLTLAEEAAKIAV